MKYKINVTTPQNVLLSFNVDKYEIVEGNFLKLFDPLHQQYKMFPTTWCEIKELEQ